MKKNPVSIIVAVGENNEIGKQGELIWRIPEDLRHFRKITMGGVLVMGRKTFESIGRPLPGRINVILTQNKNFSHKGIWIFHDPVEAIEKSFCFDKPVFIIGGEQIFKKLLPFANRIYLTKIYQSDPEADAFFFEIDSNNWELENESELYHDEVNNVDYKFLNYIRKA